ncbi:MAG TPA: RICIN domain-containing protein [Candidatus Limnocylindrales bacterium]|nr:RICIN domain-containing protein [Candidatus Limnocylindrales bacterium]
MAVSVVLGAEDDFLTDARQRAGAAAQAPPMVRVRTAGSEVAQAAGVRGVVLSLSGVDSAASAASARVRVRVGYAGWVSLFGANFGDRLRLVMLPGCALSTPQLVKCQEQTPLASTNASGEVSAELVLPSGGGSAVLAVTSSSSSAGATFSQTSLSPTYSWSAGGQGGSFSWSYPLKVPASLAGPTPDVKLAYDSGSVDGQTLAQNGQTSWVGEGWELQTGYVERSYRTCDQDGTPTPDLCWFSPYNATLVFGGRSFKLIRDNASGVWRTDDDDAFRIEQKFDPTLGNGDNDGEHWVVTTLDGTQYWFGRHSVQTVPVFGNHAGEPCQATSWCQQGYRWNLDYVVDARGNSMTLFYTEFTGYVGLNNNQSVAPYDISSTLDHIDYGTRAGLEGAAPAPMQVWFVKANRCVGSCSTAEYLDTPWDLHCASSTSCPGLTNPVFWTPYRLASVFTQVRRADGSGYRKVDQWDLTQTYPPSGDNIAPAGDDTSPNLWLQSLTHTGYADDGLATLAEPAVTFGGTAMFNRVDWGNISGTAPYTHYRLTSVLNGVGGQTLVSYSGVECVNGAAKASPGFNPLRCFPQYYKPQQAPAGWGWFNKYVVTSVTEKDLSSAATPDQTWTYAYSTASATDVSLWGHDFTETSVLALRSWPLWRGYTDVTTTHGPAGGTQTVTKTLYHRGMDGDSLATTDNQAMVWEGRRAFVITPLGTPQVTAPIGGVGGKCLEAAGGGTANGTAVQVYDCHGGANQVWQYNQDTTSPYVLTFKSPVSGRCLDVNNGFSTDGTKIQLWDCNGGVAQVWRFAPDGSLVNPATSKCLDMSASSTANQTPVLLYGCHGGGNQVLRLRADGSLFNPQNARCIDVYGGGTADGSMIATWVCNNGTAQQWTYWPSGSSLRDPRTGKCMDATGAGTANGTLIQLFACNNGPAQIWLPQPDRSLRNPNSGRCLDAGTEPYGGRQLFLWDCNGGIAQRWAHQIVDSVALAGRPREEFVMDGPTTVLGSAIHSYQVTQTGLRPKPVTNGQDLKAFMVRQTNTKTRTWIAATGAWRWTDTRTSFDSYGRPTQIDDRGDMATATDDRCVQRGYTANTTLHLIDVVQWQRTLRACTATPADADYLAETYHYYDGDTTGTAAPTQGLLTRTNVLAAVTGGVKTWKQASRAGYDSYGRITSAYDALDRLTTTAYTPAAGMPTTSVAITGPMGAGWTATTTVNPGRGTPTSVTDVNGKVSTGEYDPLGRLVRMWRNNRPTSSIPDSQYTYTLASPSWIRTQTLGPNGNQIDSYQIFDGNFGLRQTQKVTEDGKRVIADVRYDGRGLTAKESVFYNDASGPTSTLAWPVNGDADIEQQTRHVYDQLQRPTHQQLYKNDSLQFQTTTVYDGDRVGVIPPAGGTPTQDLLDAHNRLVEKRQYSGAPFTGAFTAVRYEHDRLDRLTNVTDPAGNTWTYQYDLRGRTTTTTDPDSGVTTSTCHDDHQLRSSTDARQQTLFYEYDNLGRKTRQRDTSQTGTILAEWIYDETDKGYLSTTIRHVGADRYKTRITDRDDDYQPTHSEVQIPNPTLNGALASTYSWDHTYKPNGAPATTTLPGVGGLPAEALTTGYDNNGFAQSLTGSQTYVANTDYTFDGLVSLRTLGEAGAQVKLSAQYQPHTRLLSSSSVETETTPGTFAQKHAYDYSYDAAGNITGTGTFTNGLRDQVECFRYDHLRRLTEAWTEGNSCTAPQRSGADPYWRQWTFDTVGNRLIQTDKDSVVGDTTWTYNVGTSYGAKLHQVKTITATGPKTDTPSRTFDYDPTGNTTSAVTTTGTAQTLTWDKQAHLATVTAAGTTSSYLYDADGNRLIVRTASKTTLYLPDGTELELSSGGGAALGTRYYAGIAVRTAAGLRWIATNHQNTSTVQIDSVTLAAAQRRSMPYGEDRTATPAGWVGTKGYVGGTKDETGLTHLGAREYDPTLGRFISIDPVMDLADPNQWHGYAYGNNNPTTFSDPTGLMTKVDGGGGGLGPAPKKPLKAYFKQNTGPKIDNPVLAGINSFVEGMYDVTLGGIIEYGKLVGDEAERGYTRWSNVFSGEWTLGQAWDDYVNNTLPNQPKPWDNAMGIVSLVAMSVNAQTALAQGDFKTAAENYGYVGGIAAGILVTERVFKLGRGCPHSFASTTPVLLANGTSKPIAEITVGQQVLATDPETGETTSKEVTQVHLNNDRDLAEIDILNEATEQTTTLETTWHHPFWDATVDHWTDAADLNPGTRLRDDEGKETQLVVAVRTFAGLRQMHDLTIADIHTYYVMAGNTPVLVHNSGGDDGIIGIDDLTQDQLSNYNRYVKKLPAAAEGTVITRGANGAVQFETKVPGRVPGSYALYTKTVGVDGTTIGYNKTTVVPDGSVAHVKDKFNPPGGTC